MTRVMVRKLVINIIKEDPRRNTLFNLEWFRKFVGRHPELSEKEHQVQDPFRSMISNETVIKQYCEGLSWSVARLGIENKPCQFFVTKLDGLEKKKSRKKSVWLKM
jgi:hypothetical protein